MGDEFFHAEAKQVAWAAHGTAPWHDVAITKAPAPVLYYVVPYLLVAPDAEERAYWLAGFLWNILWMAVCLLLLRRIGAVLGGRLAGYFAVLLTLASPFNVYYSYGILAEPPAYLGACLALYGWVRRHRAQREGISVEAGRGLLWLGLALFVLSRPNGILLLALMALAAFVLWRRRSPESRAAAKMTLLSVLVTGIVGAATLFAVSVLPGQSGQGGQGETLANVVFHGRFQYRTEPWDWRFWTGKTREGSRDYAAWVEEKERLRQEAEEKGIPYAELQREWILNDWITHPGITLQAVAVRFLSIHVAMVNSKKPAAFQAGPISGGLVYVVFHVVVNIANVFLILGGLFFLIQRRGQLAVYWVLWGPWLALLAFHVLTYAEPRYLFPARPGMVVMTAVVLALLLPKRWPALSRIGSTPEDMAAASGNKEP